MTAFRSFRLALVGALALSFALTACGRKGPLDPPPRASAAPASGQPPQVQSAETAEDENGFPVPPQGRKTRFPLDWLLN